jgi:hypothetical protein
LDSKFCKLFSVIQNNSCWLENYNHSLWYFHFFLIYQYRLNIFATIWRMSNKILKRSYDWRETSKY